MIFSKLMRVNIVTLNGDAIFSKLFPQLFCIRMRARSAESVEKIASALLYGHAMGEGRNRTS